MISEKTRSLLYAGAKHPVDALGSLDDELILEDQPLKPLPGQLRIDTKGNLCKDTPLPKDNVNVELATMNSNEVLKQLVLNNSCQLCHKKDIGMEIYIIQNLY